MKSMTHSKKNDRSYIYFSLAPHLYTCYFDGSIIILNSASDKYLSLIEDAAYYFKAILSSPFIKQSETTYTMLDSLEDDSPYDYWISYFIEKKFIMQSSHRGAAIAEPLQEGGLIDYRWDLKKSWKPFSEASVIATAKAFFMLAKVHRSMKHKGMQEIFDWIHDYSHNKELYEPSEKELQNLSASVDAASLIYPKKTVCFPWAVTYVLLALKKQWNIQLALGIQTNPFYAHAWAQTSSGKVINDDPVVAQVLSVIFKQPSK
jgi:hypothetical protein